MKDLIALAGEFATNAHAGQIRKYDGLPYITHPEEVARIVMHTNNATDEMIVAALLHDTVEDTNVTIEDITLTFGVKVAILVAWLTDVSRPEDGNRKLRKAMDAEHTALAPAEAHTVKLADLISNSRSIIRDDPRFAKVFIPEKKALLKVLTKGDPMLHRIASKIVLDFENGVAPDAVFDHWPHLKMVMG